MYASFGVQSVKLIKCVKLFSFSVCSACCLFWLNVFFNIVVPFSDFSISAYASVFPQFSILSTFLEYVVFVDISASESQYVPFPGAASCVVGLCVKYCQMYPLSHHVFIIALLSVFCFIQFAVSSIPVFTLGNGVFVSIIVAPTVNGIIARMSIVAILFGIIPVVNSVSFLCIFSNSWLVIITAGGIMKNANLIAFSVGISSAASQIKSIISCIVICRLIALMIKSVIAVIRRRVNSVPPSAFFSSIIVGAFSSATVVCIPVILSAICSFCIALSTYPN